MHERYQRGDHSRIVLREPLAEHLHIIIIIIIIIIVIKYYDDVLLNSRIK